MSEKLIFSCSGAADVGEISDKAARKLTKDGFGRMFCLAGVGCKLDNFIKTTQSASEILAIDGCPMECAAKNLKEAGFTNFKHFIITNHGFEKGNSPVTDKNIQIVCDKAKAL